MSSISDELLMKHKDIIKDILEEGAKFVAHIFAGKMNEPIDEEINNSIQFKLHKLLAKMMKEDKNVQHMIFRLARDME